MVIQFLKYRPLHQFFLCAYIIITDIFYVRDLSHTERFDKAILGACLRVLTVLPYACV